VLVALRSFEGVRAPPAIARKARSWFEFIRG
jgi:hypothetical protein